MLENKLVTLKLIEFNDLERNNLNVILTLASRTLKQEWSIVETETADFFLFSLAAVANLGRSDKLKSFPLERCMFCTTEQGIQTKYSLVVDEKRLPRLSVLVALFNRMVANLNAIPETKAEKLTNPTPTVDIETEINTESFFDPQQGLLAYLLTPQHPQFKISLNNNAAYSSLYIDAEKNSYYSENSLAECEPYLLNPAALIQQSVSIIEIENYINAKNLKPNPLKDLIWYIVIKTSMGKVIKGHAQNDIVMLKGWPDLRLFKCLDYAKVATFMKNNAAPLEMIAEKTKFPVTEINDFYNACAVMGLIEKREQLQLHQKDISPERLELLTKIDARLK